MKVVVMPAPGGPEVLQLETLPIPASNPARWSFNDFTPVDAIPSTVGLTVYTGEYTDFIAMPFNDLLQQIAIGTLPVTIGRVFRIEDIVEAHRTMEANKAGGTIVVLT